MARIHLARRGNSRRELGLRFFAFWLLNMYVVWRGIEIIRRSSMRGPAHLFMTAVASALLLFWS